MNFPDSLTICPYHPSLVTVLLDYILSLYRAIVGRLLLVSRKHWSPCECRQNSVHMFFNLEGDISTLNCSSLKLVDKFTYLSSSISSTESDISMCLVKAWTAIDRLLIIWKSDLSDKIKWNFIRASVETLLLYGCTTWMRTKCMKKKLGRNYTRMLQAILNKSWKEYPQNSSCMATYFLSLKPLK